MKGTLVKECTNGDESCFTSRKLFSASNEWVIGLLLVLVRLPFFWTRHIQEDAFIFFRCAKNLAETGVYGFNPFERVSVCTSHLYLFFLTCLRFLTGEYYIQAALIVGTIVTVVAIWLLANLLFPRPWSTLLWILGSLLPPALMISYSGMETSFVVLAVAILLRAVIQGKDSWVMIVSMFLLPWLRPELVALGALLCVFFVVKWKYVPWRSSLGLVLGCVALLLFNEIYFGQMVNQSILAKSVAYPTSHSMASMMARMVRAYCKLYVPISTKYLMWSGPIFLVVAFAFQIGAIWVFRNEKAVWSIAGLFMLSVAMPAMYAAGGGFFPWYCWPYQLFGEMLVVVMILWLARTYRGRGGGIYICTFFLVLLMAIGQWVLSLNWGSQEGHYRAKIGKELSKIIPRSDSLMLEPLGYIPFYAGCYTYCQVGLATPSVTAARKKHGKYWIGYYIREYRPDYLLQRTSPDEGIVEELTESEHHDWLMRSYELIRVFSYDPTSIWTHPLLVRIASLGSASNYYLYRLKQPEGQDIRE